MEAIKSFIETIYSSPHYSYGWLVLAVLAILPAIVSGNCIQHDLSKLMKGQVALADLVKSLLLNFMILLICISVVAYAFYLYIWNQA